MLIFNILIILLKKFLLNGKSKPQTNMDKLLLCNQQLNESIKDMKTSLNSLKETVDLMNSAVKQISHKVTIYLLKKK